MLARPVPQHAVVLAAGIGSRLRPLTNECPKPLVKVHGVPILHNALSNLAAVGVRKTTIVVGYRKEAIQESCGCVFAGMEVAYVPSPVFDRTGSAYSLWLARQTLLQGDVFLLEGDVFFERETLASLLRLPGDVAAVDVFDESMTGSAVALSPRGIVREIRMNQSAASLNGERLYKTVNIFRFTSGTLRHAIVPALDALIGRGRSNAYIEQLLASLVAERLLRLRAMTCSNSRWFEIDSEADLRIAERIFAPADLAATRV